MTPEALRAGILLLAVIALIIIVKGLLGTTPGASIPDNTPECTANQTKVCEDWIGVNAYQVCGPDGKWSGHCQVSCPEGSEPCALTKTCTTDACNACVASDPKACSGNGKCQTTGDYKGYCECNEGYYGIQCEKQQKGFDSSTCGSPFWKPSVDAVTGEVSCGDCVDGFGPRPGEIRHIDTGNGIAPFPFAVHPFQKKPAACSLKKFDEPIRTWVPCQKYPDQYNVTDDIKNNICGIKFPGSYYSPGSVIPNDLMPCSSDPNYNDYCSVGPGTNPTDSFYCNLDTYYANFDWDSKAWNKWVETTINGSGGSNEIKGCGTLYYPDTNTTLAPVSLNNQ